MAGSSTSLTEEILLALSISFGALFFATALTLLLARYYKKIRALCESCCHDDSSKSSGKESEAPDKQKLAQHFTPAFLQPSEDQFTIPGAFYSRSIQPQLRMTPMSEQHFNSRTYSSSSKTSLHRNKVNTGSVISLPANFSPETAKRKWKALTDSPSDDDTASLRSEDIQSFSVDDLTSFDLRPELYNISRQRTMGIGGLGKVHLSLQYENTSRKKLDVFLKDLIKLHIARSDLVSIYVSIILLPERELIYTTKHQNSSTTAVFSERFVFASKPMNRDFDSKTILVLIHNIDKSGKDIMYGEARLPLLCKEIYSQIPTDVTLNIKIASIQNEAGDILVQLIYNDLGSVEVLVKSVKLPSNMDNVSALQALSVRCYLKKLGSRVGKKILLSKHLDGIAKHNFDINRECKFKITQEAFKDHNLTFAVSGKQKYMGKKVKLGKAVIGGSSKDETGLAHWNAISNSPGIAWTVWHAIYSG